MKEQPLFSNKSPKPMGAYPPAKKVGNLLFLSGVGSRKSDNTVPGLVKNEKGEEISHDIEAECHQVFENVKTILENAGSGWDKIVDVAVFLTDMKNDFEKYNRIYAEYFREVLPCRTTIEVKSLPSPISIELKVIATI